MKAAMNIDTLLAATRAAVDGHYHAHVAAPMVMLSILSVKGQVW